MTQGIAKDQLDLIADAFDRDGYVIVRGVLSAEEMAPIQEQWQRVRDPLRNGQTIEGIKRDNFYIHGKLPSPSGDVFRHPIVSAVAQRLLGPDVALYLNRLNVKDQAFSDLIHLHQDIPYFNGGVHKINFFVALQDINLNNGGMVYVPGSHHLGILDRTTLDISKHPELEVIIPSLQPGDLVIADIRLWHSSVPNTQATDRVLLQMIFQPANDGSYYPLSVPEPQLVTGKWQTNNFPPWQIITAQTGSQLNVDEDEGVNRSGTGSGQQKTKIATTAAPPIAAVVESPANVARRAAGVVTDAALAGVPAAAAAGPRLVTRVKAAVPIWIKQPISDMVSGKKKALTED